MSKQICELTYKVVAFPEIPEAEANDGIDWAIEMIEMGHESPALYKLASVNKPANYFEIVSLVKKAVDELGLKMKNGDAAILSYAAYYVHQIGKGEQIRENLTQVYKLCQARDYEQSVYDFCLLFWAWDQLEYEDSGNNHYWDGARRSNIEQIVVDEAKKWIEKNRKYFSQI